ncbi:RNA 2',3'-cyclic phosphodiesterase [Piscibacillus salipiscarius]|uniref:RNA 2',3'-cyclic phosphodiesterase n=1 Tax=Piscibacillus salipiscarius TaxID=299480 RepID=UPI002437447F|nr:RNA 2',3'-cyclic phosphodiesterase [Piscibacillus salipiscarius]
MGFSVPQEYKEFLVKWQEALKPFVDYHKWVHGDDFHVTLRFLGAVKPKTLHQLKRLLSTLKSAPLELQMNGLNFFGKEEQPRVMYAEIERDQEVLDFKTWCG